MGDAPSFEGLAPRSDSETARAVVEATRRLAQRDTSDQREHLTPLAQLFTAGISLYSDLLDPSKPLDELFTAAEATLSSPAMSELLDLLVGPFFLALRAFLRLKVVLPG